MNDELILTLTSTILAILLLLSEWLGMSKCSSNSILQVLRRIKFSGCTEPHIEPASSTSSIPPPP